MSIFRKKVLSSAEITGKLKQEAKRLGVDDESLMTSLGGMTKDHYELYCRVRDTKNVRYARQAAWWAGIGVIISVVFLIYSICK